MPDILSVCETIARAKEEGYPISECALRGWIKRGDIPVRHSGRRILLYYPNVVRFLTCEDGCDNRKPQVQVNRIPRIDPGRR